MAEIRIVDRDPEGAKAREELIWAFLAGFSEQWNEGEEVYASYDEDGDFRLYVAATAGGRYGYFRVALQVIWEAGAENHGRQMAYVMKRRWRAARSLD